MRKRERVGSLSQAMAYNRVPPDAQSLAHLYTNTECRLHPLQTLRPWGPTMGQDRLHPMEDYIRKPRRTESSEERSARLAEETRSALDRALAEQDAIDAMIRRSIQLHGP